MAYIDWLRLAAVFQMLQGHTIAALLAPEHRHGVVHALWSSARGLTSVAFLFASGFAFYVTTSRDFAARHRSPTLLERRARRGLQLIVLGYALHFPVALWLGDDPQAGALALRSFVAIDVLQCIGASLLLLQVITWIAARTRSLGIACAAMGACVLVLTPMLREARASGALEMLIAYVSPSAGSTFPILPWASHMFFGVASAAWLQRPSRFGPASRLLALACGVLACVWTARELGADTLVLKHMVRLACVLIATAGCAWLSRRLPIVPARVQTLTSQALFLYVFHVLLVYGQGVGLAARIGATLSPVAAISVAAAVVSLSSAAALGFAQLSSRRLARAAVPG